jgi:hypothetical protein
LIQIMMLSPVNANVRVLEEMKASCE